MNHVQTATIGRDPGCEVRVNDQHASDRHAKLTRHPDNTVTVEDLGSTNGTWVNGVRVYGPTLLRSGDRLRVGRSEVTVPW